MDNVYYKHCIVSTADGLIQFVNLCIGDQDVV